VKNPTQVPVQTMHERRPFAKLLRLVIHSRGVLKILPFMIIKDAPKQLMMNTIISIFFIF